MHSLQSRSYIYTGPSVQYTFHHTKKVVFLLPTFHLRTPPVFSLYLIFVLRLDGPSGKECMTEGEEPALVENAQSADDGVLILSSAHLQIVTINIFMLYSS